VSVVAAASSAPCRKSRRGIERSSPRFESVRGFNTQVNPFSGDLLLPFGGVLANGDSNIFTACSRSAGVKALRGP
jgi:hypothetical protein